MQGEFTAPAPDVVWVADITYVWTWEGWLDLATVLDVCSRRVVGWAHAGGAGLRRAADGRRHPRWHGGGYDLPLASGAASSYGWHVSALARAATVVNLAPPRRASLIR